MDDKLILAAKEAQRQLAEEYPLHAELAYMTFSSEFERKMNRLVRLQQKSYYKLVSTSARQAVCIIAALLTLTAASMSIEAVREPVVRLFVQVFEKFTRFGAKGDIVGADTGLEGVYAPAYIPDGFVTAEEHKSPFRYIAKYVQDDRYIFFTVRTITSGSMGLNTETVSSEKTTVNGMTGTIYSTEDMMFIEWHNDKYVFLITCNIDESEALKIANSTNID